MPSEYDGSKFAGDTACPEAQREMREMEMVGVFVQMVIIVVKGREEVAIRVARVLW